MAKTTLKKKKSATEKIVPVEDFEIHPNECPFREFKDSELGHDYWGKGPNEVRQMQSTGTHMTDTFWVDHQIQPLPRTAKIQFCSWIRAKDYAEQNWKSEVMVTEPPQIITPEEDGKMKMRDFVISYRRILSNSSFVRQVLAYCYLLERSSLSSVMHQNEHFFFAPNPNENWRAKHHIYSPGMKPGGGSQHQPQFSPKGCYLVRLFFLGAWRCIWVDDQVPVDEDGDALLPFGPVVAQKYACKLHVKSHSSTSASQMSTPNVSKPPNIYLWPLLMCKALLKLFAPDTQRVIRKKSVPNRYDEFEDEGEDELLGGFDIMHHLTGMMKTKLNIDNMGFGKLWERILTELELFEWPDPEPSLIDRTSTKAQKSSQSFTKKSGKTDFKKFEVIVIMDLSDTEEIPPYELAGLTPAHAAPILVTMARDLPLKRPPPLPAIAPWKKYRWLEWAKLHGLYDDYTCPRTKYLQISGLMRLSYATYLMDVHSTESICANFRLDMEEVIQYKKKSDEKSILKHLFPEDGIWVLFRKLVSHIDAIYFSYPITNDCKSIGVATQNKNKFIRNPKEIPVYMIVDSGTDSINIKFCFSSLSRNILSNTTLPVEDYDLLYPGLIIIETFDWLAKSLKSTSRKSIMTPVAFLRIRGTCSSEINLPPGRHNFRIWAECRTPWNLLIMSSSEVLLGNRSYAMAMSSVDSSWALKMIAGIEQAFLNWTRTTENIHDLQLRHEFFRSYRPDKPWEPEDIGYPECAIHWMLRISLQHYLKTRLHPFSYINACDFFKVLFLDPMFGCYHTDFIEKSEFDFTTDYFENLLLDIDEELLRKASKATVANIQSMSGERYIEDDGEMRLSAIHTKYSQEYLEKYAVKIQRCWRRYIAQKIYKQFSQLEASEVSELLTAMTFGDRFSLSKILNIMFDIFPGTKQVFSFGNGIAGSCKVSIFSDTLTNLSPKRSWIPLCQGIFFCHSPTSVQFDLECSTNKQWLLFYNNDTMEEIRIGSRPKMTYMFTPNKQGYTLYGHARIWQKQLKEVEWKLSILSRDETFHSCTNEWPDCVEKSITSTVFFELEDFYLPNETNVALKVLIKVLKDSFINMSARFSNSKLPIKVQLRDVFSNNIIDTREGFGDYFWSHLKLEYREAKKSKETIPVVSKAPKLVTSIRRPKASPEVVSKRPASPAAAVPQPTVYSIEVTAPEGWPMTTSEWKRVEDVRYYNYVESLKPKISPKRSQPDKKNSARMETIVSKIEILPTDCYCRVEISSEAKDNVVCFVNDDMIKAWKEQVAKWSLPGRVQLCTDIRQAFIKKYEVDQSEPPQEPNSPVSTSPTVISTKFSSEELITAPSEISHFFQEPTFNKKPSSFKLQFMPFEFIPPYPDPRPKFVDYYPMTEDGMLETRIKLMKEQKEKNGILKKFLAKSAWSETMNEALLLRRNILAEAQAMEVLENVSAQAKSNTAMKK